MKKKSQIWLGVVLIVGCLFIIGIASWAIYENNKKQEASAGGDTQIVENVADTSIGDTNTEDSNIEGTAGEQSDGSRNYDFLFEPVEEYLDLADIKIINQETIFGGNSLGFSGFPYFNSPTEVGDAIVNAGFNVVLQASNHSADQGIKGINHCISYWEQYPDVLTDICGQKRSLETGCLVVRTFFRKE